MVAGADASFFCPIDGVAVSPASNNDISQTFTTTVGSSIVPTSASVVGTIFPGSSINFSIAISPQTFDTTTGSEIVPTSASVVGEIYPGAQIVFGSDATVYTIATVNSSQVTLTANYTGSGSSTDTATVNTANYTVAKVTASQLTLTEPVSELTASGTTGTVVGGTDLTSLFANQPYARRIAAVGQGTLIVNMLGVYGTVTPVTLYVNNGGFWDGLFTSISSGSGATGLVAFQ